MDLSIREVRPDDAEAVVSILNPIIADGRFTVLDTPLTVQAESEFIAGFPQRGLFLVAVRESDRAVVGFQSLEPFADYTHAFDHVGVLATFVDLSQRRKGIAKRLFEATFQAAVERGYEKIFTFVRADNPAALQTYLSQGFRVVGTARRQAKIKGNYVDEVMIEKWLGRGGTDGAEASGESEAVS